MLLAVCLDNKIKPTEEILKRGQNATILLMEDHASEFTNPSTRRKVLKRFLEKSKKLIL